MATATTEITKIDARVIAIDETELCIIAPEDHPFIERVVGVYFYDHNRRVHCCELTASYELQWLYDEVRLTPEGYDLDDDAREALYEKYECHDRDPVHYFHCHTIDRLSERLGRGDYYREEIAVDEDYDTSIDELLEHLNCNHPF
jgi:hypothetical protein